MYHKVISYIIVIAHTFLAGSDGYYESSNSIRTRLVNTKSMPVDHIIEKPEFGENKYEEVKLIINKFKNRYKYEETITPVSSNSTTPDGDKSENQNRFIDFEDSDDDDSDKKVKSAAQVKTTTTESSIVDLIVGKDEDEDEDDDDEEEDDDDEDDEDEEEEEEDEDDQKSKDKKDLKNLQDLRQNRKKYVKAHKIIFPLLLAYKLKFFTMVPLLVGSLVLLVGTTGMAGFFFALFAAAMGLHVKSSH